MTTKAFEGYAHVDFTGLPKRPSAPQVCAAWVKAGSPKTFDAMWGENGTRFVLEHFHVSSHSLGFRPVCKNLDKAELLICNKAFGKPVNDFNVPQSASTRLLPRP
jgi:hypothetical protein